ncbi:UAP56-interacting factor-like [Paramormyrops kingsleyae]|uniref:UAP56-interacting factor-like n=1 Tax=Paramormyrops kingsleyae TaxID=1676925 RepID=UPI003B97CAC2
MGDNIAEPEAMEETNSSEKIDLSLDDIIKLKKEEENVTLGGFKRKNRQANRSNLFKKFNKAGQQQGFRFRRGTYHMQGLNRFRYIGPPVRDFYRSRPYNRGRSAPKGISPMNRPQWDAKNAKQFGQRSNRFRGSFYQPYRGQRGPPRRMPLNQSFQYSQQRPYRAKPVKLNRAFSSWKWGEKPERFQKVRRWGKAPSSGSILTVSLPNSKANSDPQAIQPSVSDRPLGEGDFASPQPKGIPLRFNFKAVSNQTSLTLNDRFTNLKIRGGWGHRLWRGRGRGSRMVTLQ